MIADSYPIKEVDNVIFEVDCGGIILDSVAVDDGDYEPCEVNDVAYCFRLQPTRYDKKNYVSSLRSYLRTVKRRLLEIGKDPEYVANFEKSAQDFLKTKLLPNFDDWEFFTGESMDSDGMVAIMGYREDGTTPYFMFWKDGLEEMRI
ncbi:hypothetical protein HG531_013133 [Fusarium graminearum]|nr:hypothetical protein HG531_013133 [Fusarium graminearum]